MGDFLMPSLGADMEAGTLVEWLVKPGDRVKRGDVVAVVETQKGAIEIEIVNVEEWRRDFMSANAPGLPSADDSISSTRVTLPEDLLPDTNRVDAHRLEPEHPHWPLVLMLVLTQLSVGAFAVLWLLYIFSRGADLTMAAIASLGLAGVSLGASTLHLGRPVYAFRALKGLRRSWLSREVLSLSLFAGAAGLFAGMLFFNLPARGIAGLLTCLAGVAGVTCSARIYIVRARPAWFSGHTLAEFYATGLMLGPMFVSALTGASAPTWVRYAGVSGGALQLITQLLKFLWLSRSETFELRGSSLLLSGRLRRLFVARLVLLAFAGVVLPLIGGGWKDAAAFGLALCGEWLGRYLFFVSVVPKNIAAAFTSGERRPA